VVAREVLALRQGPELWLDFDRRHLRLAATSAAASQPHPGRS